MKLRYVPTYPLDRGIAQDPQVLLAETCEDGGLASLLAKWTR